MKGKEQIEQMCNNMTTMSGVACAVIDEHNQVLFHSTDNSASVCMEDSLRGRIRRSELFYPYFQTPSRCSARKIPCE